MIVLAAIVLAVAIGTPIAAGVCSMYRMIAA